MNLSPRSFLRARRPERFSDSVVNDVPVLDRSLLEYHLETITNRSDESDFQEFARHLAEREICPNLLPQTGPTGGGDSKVDSETYPVADSLSLVWYVGDGREAARIVGENLIRKTEVNVRDAWEIGVGDVDSQGILPTDTPIIPNNQPNPPVLELIQRKQSH